MQTVPRKWKTKRKQEQNEKLHEPIEKVISTIKTSTETLNCASIQSDVPPPPTA